MYTIDKQFSFCYGHRVWSQKLIAEYCETGDTACKCRFMHGHQATVHVFLEADILERGMVLDFKMLGWLNTFFNDHLDHKFIVDLNDPWFNNITGLEPVYVDGSLRHFTGRRPFNTTTESQLIAKPVYVPGTQIITGWKADVFEMAGPEREFIEGFFFTKFLPTSEHFSQWVHGIATEKFRDLNVRVSRVDWWETPKSRSSYTE